MAVTSRLVPGDPVRWESRDWILVDIVSTTEVLLVSEHEPDLQVHAPIALVRPLASVAEASAQVVHAVERDDWARACEIFSAITPLLGPEARSAQDYEQVAARLGKSVNTVFRYVALWKERRRVSAFLRKTRSDRNKPGSRLPEEIRQLAEAVVEEHYLKEQRLTYVQAWEQLCLVCRERNLDAPSLKTFALIAKARPQKYLVRGRYGRKFASEKYEFLRGSYPGADFPLAVVQIDHTPIDLILVDDEMRESVNRANLTIVVDVCTRMVMGFCITFEKPGALSVMLALSHAMLPKDEWLKERGIDATWPVWGIVRKIFADNAKEFRGKAIARGCAEHNIIIENRPRGLPNYGGHVERLFRTMMKRTQALPGSTFSNTVDRRKYDSEGRAIFTLAEYERWFTIFVLRIYHNRRHRATGYPPINLLLKLAKGDEHTPGVGLPEPIADPRRLMLDFLPHFNGTVQRYGVMHEGITYQAEVLRSRVLERDARTGKARQFLFAYDPRNMACIYFYDPDGGGYHTIPYANRERPPASLWEIKLAKRALSRRPGSQSNEDEIFKGLAEMRAQEAESSMKTKKARIGRVRRRAWQAAQASSATGHAPSTSDVPDLTAEDNEAVTPLPYEQPDA